MTRTCDFCDESLLDGEDIGFVAEAKYKYLASKITYAISKNFEIKNLYHKACLNYLLGGTK